MTTRKQYSPGNVSSKFSQLGARLPLSAANVENILAGDVAETFKYELFRERPP